MPDLLCGDFETFYAPRERYSLKVMDNEQYIADSRFEAYGFAYAYNKDTPRFLQKAEIKPFLDSVDWQNTIFAAHNAKFDAAILAWRFGKTASSYIDTMGVANCYIVPYTGRADLDNCMKFMGMTGKSGVLKQVEGLRYDDILAVPGLIDNVGDYACNDVLGVQALVNNYWRGMIIEEKIILSWTVENYVKGRVRINVPQLRAILEELQATRQGYLDQLGLTDKQLRSRDGFTKLLREHGIEIEYKEGKNQDIPALAKDDPFMKALVASDDPKVSYLAKARLAFASNGEITRTQRLLDMAERTNGKMLFPLNYSAARTGRFGGSDGVNPQNFGRKSKIKNAIHAPPGKVIIQVDQSQIEARIVAYLSGCTELIEAFREKRDVYSEFASVVYGYPVNKKDHPTERQAGKVFILQLGYQSGGAKLQRKLADVGIFVDLATAEGYVRTYRQKYKQIPSLWYLFQRMLAKAITTRDDVDWLFGMKFTPTGIRLPSTRWLLYDNLCLNEAGVPQYYDPRYKSWNQLYGGATVENVGQAIARDVTNQTLVRFHQTCVLQVHDNVYRLVDDKEAGNAFCGTMHSMKVVPKWLYHPPYGVIPLDCEGFCTNTLASPD